MKTYNHLVTYINKLGGVISDLPDAFGAPIERPFACMSVRKAALLVPALWCFMASAPLVLTSCSEDERVATPDAADTRIDAPSDTLPSDSTHTSDAAPDTGSSFNGEITDWEEGKGEVTPAR